MKKTLREALIREAVIHRLIQLNVFCVDGSLIEIAGKLGATCVVVAHAAGLGKEGVIKLLSECYDRVENLERELGLDKLASAAGITDSRDTDNVKPD